MSQTEEIRKDIEYTKGHDRSEESRLRSLNAEMLAMLEMVEWAGFEWYGLDHWNTCPVCSKRETGGHEADCELAALIARAKGAAS